MPFTDVYDLIDTEERDYEQWSAKLVAAGLPFHITLPVDNAARYIKDLLPELIERAEGERTMGQWTFYFSEDWSVVLHCEYERDAIFLGLIF